MEREKFEESWKGAFDKAEVSPSEKVWTNIELDLEKAKGGDLKRRLMFYQMLAAASVVFALAIAGIGYYYSFNDQNSGNSLAQETPRAAGTTPTSAGEETNDEVLAETSIANLGSDANADGATRQNSQRSVDVDESRQQELQRQSDSQNFSIASAESIRSGDIKKELNTAGSLTSSGDNRYPELPVRITDGDLPALYTPREVHLEIRDEKQEVDPVAAMLAKIEQREKEVQEDGKKKDNDAESEKLWTSIGFAAGSFNSIQTSAPSSPQTMGLSSAALAAPIVDQESKATGYSYSMGVNVGTRISERWVLQGGVNYLTHSSEYTADNVVMMESRGSTNYAAQRFMPSATNGLVHADADELTSKIVYTAPYSVNNSMRYLSIPMQAGYLIVDRTFGVQVNAGVATDLFLQNTVKGEGDQLAKTTQPVGSNSPYRTVNLSGLFGTEFSYRFGPHYRVSLNPGIRYPFNTIYKSEIGVQSTPLTFDVGLRFRYIFH